MLSNNLYNEYIIFLYNVYIIFHEISVHFKKYLNNQRGD